MSPSVPSLKLYEISDNYTAILNQLAEQVDTNGVIPDAIGHALSQLDEAFESKAVNVAAYILTLEAEASAIANVKTSMERRMSSLSSQALRLRDYLKAEMERTGILHLKHPLLNVMIRNNPSTVVVSDATRLPDGFTETITNIKILKTAIAQALKSGQEVPGAHLEQSTRLVIQ